MWMAWGRSNEQWNHTASIMSALVGVHWSEDNGPAPEPATFHPYMAESEPPPVTSSQLAGLGFKPAKKAKPKAGDA